MPKPVSLFLDLDGVLADMDAYYQQQFGVALDRNTTDPPGMWTNIKKHGSFYKSLPVMPDALDLWRGVKEYFPAILTGVPWGGHGILDADDQKRWWVAEHIDPRVEVVCCRSKDKSDFCRPGDILVDDWKKYRHLWEAAGGTFVLHTSAAESLAQVHALLR